MANIKITEKKIQEMVDKRKTQIYNDDKIGSSKYWLEWKSESASNICKDCAILDGKIFVKNKPHPKPPLHPNCRCKLVAAKPDAGVIAMLDLSAGYKFYVVDRIEDNTWAVLYDDNDNKLDIPLTILPKNVKEGDILRFDERNQIWVIDEEETARRKPEIRERFWGLFHGYEPPSISEPETTETEVDINNNSFLNFLETLGFRESGNNYDIVNQYGYMGKYQFGPIALRDIGFYDNNNNWTEKAKEYGVWSKETFLNNPEAQESAIRMLLKNNWRYATNYSLLDYIGIEMNGVLITESGLLAAAHLIGVGGIKKALETSDLTSVKDGNGVTAKEYMELFGGYNIDAIK